MDDRDRAYIWDMNQAANEIMDFISGMDFKRFGDDKRTRYAVERQLLVIGEAANHISEEFRKANEQIPWRNIIGLRNIIAHDYGEILSERIWLVVKESLPELIEFLKNTYKYFNTLLFRRENCQMITTVYQGKGANPMDKTKKACSPVLSSRVKKSPDH